MCTYLPNNHRKLTGTCFIYGRRTAYNAPFDSLTFSYITIVGTAKGLHEFCKKLRDPKFGFQTASYNLVFISNGLASSKLKIIFYERKKDLHVLRKCKSPAATVLCDPPHSLFQMFSLPDKRPTVKEIAFKISLLKHFRVSLFLI